MFLFSLLNYIPRTTKIKDRRGQWNADVEYQVHKLCNHVVLHVYQGLSQAMPLRQSRTNIEIVPQKKTAKGTICPLQNLGGKLRRKHTRRYTVQYKN